MTKNEKEIITIQLERTYRCVLEEFHKDKNSVEYAKAVARYAQMERLAETLCHKNANIEEYFKWSEYRKNKIYEDTNK